jgi:2-oxoglutarate ferredoxin oxidoreductase subunit alpha
MMTMELMEGSEALVEAALAAECRFFAGYPMTPFSEVLEHFARKLPGVGGVCINAESEIEAVNMAWGAAAAGFRSATGSTGQGLSLMQEALSEISMAELPLVVFNMARGQSDYLQATRGGGHGDYRTPVLAPADVQEAVELVQLGFELADRWRNPVVIYGDYLIAHTWQSVAVPKSCPQAAPKDWAVDGGRGTNGAGRHVTPLGFRKIGTHSPGIEGHLRAMAVKSDEISRSEGRFDLGDREGAEVVIVSFGTVAAFVRDAVRTLRACGVRAAWFRPVTLWPFPSEALRRFCAGANEVIVVENNAGQMVEDVRLSLLGQVPISFAGDISHDHSGFGVGSLMSTDEIAQRIRWAIDRKEPVA